MSCVLPTIKTQFSLGPDHRNHAPELEWGGSIAQWARSQPFDTYSAMGPADFARERGSGEITGRQTPLQAAALLDRYAVELNRLAAVLPYGNNPILDDLILDGRMCEALARYYSTRLKAACAYALAEYRGTADAGSKADLTALVDASLARWKALAELGDANYRPFLDTLRMHTETYLWSQATTNFARDATDVRTMFVSDVPCDTMQPELADGRELRLRVWPDDIDRRKDQQALTVHATVAGLGTDEKIRKVNLLWKPFRSEAAWRRIPMENAAADWAAQVDINAEGAMYGLEVITTRNATMAHVDGERPYGVINPWPLR
jgi:hypothetical protein